MYRVDEARRKDIRTEKYRQNKEGKENLKKQTKKRTDREKDEDDSRLKKPSVCVGVKWKKRLP